MAKFEERNNCKKNDIQRPAEGSVVYSGHIAEGADLCSDGIYNHLVGDCDLTVVEKTAKTKVSYKKGQVISISKDDNYKFPGLDETQIQINNIDLFRQIKRMGHVITLKVTYVLKKGTKIDLVAFEVLK